VKILTIAGPRLEVNKMALVITLSKGKFIDDPNEYKKMALSHNPHEDGKAVENIISI
jgi:UDP-N-acetylglucosamine 2-epimerase